MRLIIIIATQKGDTPAKLRYELNRLDVIRKIREKRSGSAPRRTGHKNHMFSDPGVGQSM